MRIAASVLTLLPLTASAEDARGKSLLRGLNQGPTNAELCSSHTVDAPGVSIDGCYDGCLDTDEDHIHEYGACRTDYDEAFCETLGEIHASDTHGDRFIWCGPEMTTTTTTITTTTTTTTTTTATTTTTEGIDPDEEEQCSGCNGCLSVNAHIGTGCHTDWNEELCLRYSWYYVWCGPEVIDDGPEATTTMT